jgi:hypothetical protein
MTLQEIIQTKKPFRFLNGDEIIKTGDWLEWSEVEFCEIAYNSKFVDLTRNQIPQPYRIIRFISIDK